MISKHRKDNQVDGRFLLLLALVLAFLAILYNCSAAQEIQEKEIKDFSGGLVNSISNVRIQENQAVILDNYDVDDGVLRPRPGINHAYADTMSDSLGQAVMAYYGRDVGQQLLMIRNGQQLNDTFSQVEGQLGAVYALDDANDVGTTLVNYGMYFGRKHHSYPYNYGSEIINGNIVIASRNSELFVWDGNNRHMARPYVYGQPRVYPLDGGGNITGYVRYRYKWSNTACHAASASSWQINVTSGKVFITNILPSAGAPDTTLIYREDNNSGVYRHIATIQPTDTGYVDNLSLSDAEDSTALVESGLPTTGSIASTTDSLAPGGLKVLIGDSSASPGYGIWLDTIGLTPVIAGAVTRMYYFVVYTYAFIDSAGRATYVAPPCFAKVGDHSIFGAPVHIENPDSIPPESIFVAAGVHNFPQQPTGPDSASIVKMYLLRMFLDPNPRKTQSDPGFQDGMNAFFIVDSMNWDTTLSSYLDTTRYDYWPNMKKFTDIPYALFTDSILDDSDPNDSGPNGNWYFHTTVKRALLPKKGKWGGYNTMTLQDVMNDFAKDDSAITFQPSDIELFHSRLYAVGDPWNKNYLYFSDFGKPTTWPNQKFISIPSQQSDWFNGLLALGDNLLAFRQNSFVSLSGLTFYQYKIREISNNIGLTAPMSLAGGLNRAYFAHATGVYAFPGQGWDIPISWPIKNSIDSAGEFLRTAWGGLIGNEYWISMPGSSGTVNSKTYIFTPSPVPHWKTYDFGILSGSGYDNESDGADYRPSKWIFLLDNDSLWEWGYDLTDSTDSDTNRIWAVYQSKYFFDNSDDREVVFSIDLKGTGVSDSIGVTILDKKGQTAIETVWKSVDFDSNDREIFKFNKILKNVSVKIEDHGYGGYSISSYIINYVPWDGGRNR